MNPPDFLIIGAQKCGTSWLHRQLRQHPDVYMPPDKDAPYFFKRSEDTKNFLRRFEGAPPDAITGDACASYFWTRNTGPYPNEFNADISSAISHELGNKMKLIVLLKDPVQRTVSAYLHHIAHRSLAISCGILDAPKELGLISLSRFGLHLQHWREDYSPDRILILPAPDSVNGETILNKTSRFLDLPGDFQFPGSQEKVFAGLEKKYREDGIWACLNHPESIYEARTEHFPSIEIEGKTFFRLIQASELYALSNELHQDAVAMQQALNHDAALGKQDR